jgi:hypothetical protein
MSPLARTGLAPLVLAAVTSVALAGCYGNSGPGHDATGAKAVYSKTTGKLELITYDTNKDGKVDAWSHMEGARLVSMELDWDFDGVVDRWEHYGPAGNLEKVGYSRANDGKADAWAYQNPDGHVARIEVSTRRDGKVNRTEFYHAGKLARVEEDSDGDGKPDKWETYLDGAILSADFDIDRDGRPDRRLTYGPTGVKADILK